MPGSTHSGGVVFRLTKSGPRYLLVEASGSKDRWVLPKGNIEKGESAVTIGAYLRVLAALGLQLTAGLPQQSAEAHRSGWLPARIRIADYPWLRQLAWQVHGPQELTPREALGIYERNWRHLDPAALSADERDLVESLR